MQLFPGLLLSSKIFGHYILILNILVNRRTCLREYILIESEVLLELRLFLLFLDF